MKIVMAGQGAFGQKHLDAIKNIPDIEVVSLAGGSTESTKEVAEKYGIPHWSTDLGECLAQPGVEAAILTTPTQMHAAQGIQCMEAGKHVMIEIPMADNLADSKRLVEVQKKTGLVAMAGHTRRFNPSHQWVHKKIKAGELNIQQMDVQTYFFRRTNMNALGKPRSWTDHLLWHHACHTVDLFAYQTGQKMKIARAVQGPIHPELGIAMDMSIQLKAEIDVSKVDVSMNGIELQDREFFAAIKEGREPNASVAQVLPAMQTLDTLEQDLNHQGA
jgi:2-hydroxy-4-carboxymuconate semialdehyde hemiacetal dehydrogenase